MVEGDLKELLGRVRAVLEDGRVEIMPSMKDLDEVLTFEPGQLAKYFQARRPLRWSNANCCAKFAWGAQLVFCQSGSCCEGPLHASGNGTPAPQRSLQ